MNRQRALWRYVVDTMSIALIGVGWLCIHPTRLLACNINSIQVTSANCTALENDMYSCTQGAEVTFTPTISIVATDSVTSLKWLLDGTSIRTISPLDALSLTYAMKAAGKHEVKAIVSCKQGGPHSRRVFPIVNFTLTIIPHDGVKVVGTTGTGDGILCEPADKGTSRCQETYSGLQGAGVKAIVVKQGTALLGWKVNGKFVTPEEFMQMVTGQ